MRLSGALLFSVAAATSLWACVRHEAGCQVTPAIFCGPYRQWDANLSPEMRSTLKAMDADHMPILSWQFGAGVRGDFDLWKDNEITRFFRAQGLKHPDYMSQPFTRGFIGYLNGSKVDMAKIAREEATLLTPPPPPTIEHRP